MTATIDTAALTGTWVVDPAHSSIGFTARHAMVTKVRGSFKTFEGTLVLDAATPGASTVTITVDPTTVETGQADRDNHLRSADFFEVETYPNASFTSTSITKVSDSEYTLTGDLSIRGVTKSVTLDVEFTGLATDPFGNVRAGFETSLDLSRKDFGLTWNAALETGGVLVSDKVKLEIDFSVIKQA